MTTVYILRAADGTVLYVGCSVNPKYRVRQHRRKPWGDLIAEVTTEQFADHDEALIRERDLIVALRPAKNVAHNTGRWTHCTADDRALTALRDDPAARTAMHAQAIAVLDGLRA